MQVPDHMLGAELAPEILNSPPTGVARVFRWRRNHGQIRQKPRAKSKRPLKNQEGQAAQRQRQAESEEQAGDCHWPVTARKKGVKVLTKKSAKKKK
jgi:hypothetical protein